MLAFLRLILNAFLVCVWGRVGGRQKTRVQRGTEFELQLWKAASTNTNTGFRRIFAPLKSSEVQIRLVLMIINPLLLSGCSVKKSELLYIRAFCPPSCLQGDGNKSEPLAVSEKVSSSRTLQPPRWRPAVPTASRSAHRWQQSFSSLCKEMPLKN